MSIGVVVSTTSDRTAHEKVDDGARDIIEMRVLGLTRAMQLLTSQLALTSMAASNLKMHWQISSKEFCLLISDRIARLLALGQYFSPLQEHFDTYSSSYIDF